MNVLAALAAVVAGIVFFLGAIGAIVLSAALAAWMGVLLAVAVVLIAVGGGIAVPFVRR